MNPLDLFATRHATLRSPLSPAVCAERIGAITDRVFSFMGTKPLIGMTSPTGATVRRRLPYRNSWQTQLNAAFEPSGAGTTIRCRFGMLMIVKVFMVVWLVFALVIGLAFATAGLGGSIPGSSPLFALFPLLFVAFGVLMLFVGRKMAGKDESILLELVRAATDATVTDRDPGYVELDRSALENNESAVKRQRVIFAVIIGALLLLGVLGSLVSRMFAQ